MRKKYMKMICSWSKGEARLSETDRKHLWSQAAFGNDAEVIQFLEGIAQQCALEANRLKAIYKAETK